MTVDLVDALKLYELDAITGAELTTRRGDLFLQFVVHHEIKLCIGITVFEMIQHVSHGRTESVEVL